TTLHTVLAEPKSIQRDAMRRIIDISAKIIIMSEKGRELLRSVHDVPADKIEVIPHGIPDFPFLETHHAKAEFGFGGKSIILTFGLLSPNKGIEIMLDDIMARRGAPRNRAQHSDAHGISFMFRGQASSLP